MKLISITLLTLFTLTSCAFLAEEEPEIEKIMEDAVKYEGKK